MICKVPTPAIVAALPAVKLPATPATVNWVTLRAAPLSTSLSLASTPVAAVVVSGVSSPVVLASATAMGASLVPVMVKVSVVVEVAPAVSRTVYENCSVAVWPAASASAGALLARYE